MSFNSSILKGQYIVVLHDPSQKNSWKDFCFKQYRDSQLICPESTPNSPNNSLTGAESYAVRDDWWRFATEEEIARYDAEGFFKITSEPKKPVIIEINNYQVW